MRFASRSVLSCFLPRIFFLAEDTLDNGIEGRGGGRKKEMGRKGGLREKTGQRTDVSLFVSVRWMEKSLLCAEYPKIYRKLPLLDYNYPSFSRW